MHLQAGFHKPIAHTQNRDVRSSDDSTLRYRFEMKKEP